MNPLDFAARVLRDVYGDRLTDPDAAPVPEPVPVAREVAQPNPYRAEPSEDLSPWEFTRADEVAEDLVVQRLAVETAARGSWEAALRLFAPEGSCAGLYATQTPEPCLSRVSVSPDAHRPAQPLP